MSEARIKDFYDKMVKAGLYKPGEVDLSKVATTSSSTRAWAWTCARSSPARVTTGGAPWWWLKVMGDPGRKLFVRGLRALFARNCRTVWLQLHNMNNVSRDECAAFLARVSRTLGAIT
jgi:hypothetical protein